MLHCSLDTSIPNCQPCAWTAAGGRQPRAFRGQLSFRFADNLVHFSESSTALAEHPRPFLSFSFGEEIAESKSQDETGAGAGGAAWATGAARAALAISSGDCRGPAAF